MYVRYGWFKRDTIKSSVTSYGNRPNRADCAAAPNCTYDEELNNYARWYTYYRLRIQTMKSSVGLSFLPFIGNPSGTPPKPNALRLGLITMHAQDSGSVSAAKYLRISDFDTTQASNFYTKFYQQTPPNATPRASVDAPAGTDAPALMLVMKDRGTIRLIGTIFTPVWPGVTLAWGVSGMV